MKRVFTVAICLAASLVQAEPPEIRYETVPEEFRPYIYAPPGATDWFEVARFGVFVHWGPYVLAEVPASWGRHGPRPGAGRPATSGVPQEEYDNLYKQFNPVRFDADQWIRMVKESGAKYFIFTTKHHDGFCMFDAKNTDYKITNTPFGRNVAKELADACHRHEIQLFWYYSQPDWHHPDCLTERNARYRQYMYEHLEQLLTEYGPVAGLFFDGLGTQYYDWDTPRMLKMCRTLQPGILVNRRWGGGIPGFPVSGDYENPEQEIGHFRIDRPWETNLTMSTAWSWTGGERVKTFQTCLRLLIQCVGSGGNLALNTGPKPDGTINPPEAANYRRIGQWLAQSGESIYGTTGGPYTPAPWGVSCHKGDKIYLHLLSKFAGRPQVTIPPLPASILDVKAMTGGLATVEQTDGGVTIKLDPNALDPIDNIVVLTVDTNAADIPVIESTKDDQRLPLVTADASSGQTGNNSVETLLTRAAGNFIEGKSHKGWWAAKKTDPDPWLTIEFGQTRPLNYVALSEQIRNCSVRRFLIEYDVDGTWKPLYEGGQIGMDFSLHTPTLRTTKLRLRILETDADNAPNILAFDAYDLP